MNESQKNVRVRFAPSPTGHLHVGGARTALYNWLFARSQGGTFILRIEDTDLSRSTDEAIAQIIDSMKWLGLDWDEGHQKDGAFGPYRQMERMDMYRSVADRLLAAGAAYWCFCTPEDLEKEREEAKAQGRAYIYSGKCLGLPEDDVNQCLATGRQPVVRLKAPRGGVTVVRDIVHGDVTFENALIGDIILVRSTGVPTYNFAVAVDDSMMEITHVIRGDDHLPNTPKQMLVLDALGKGHPVYAHLPLILGEDRAPLSKRHGSASLEEFRSGGYLREALTNFLALLGWSYDAETTLFSIDELVEKFSIERVGNTGAYFDTEKLLWMNGHYIRSLSVEELSMRLRDYLAGTEIGELAASKGRPSIEDLVPMVQEKLKTLADFVPLTDFFFLPAAFEEKALERLRGDERAREVLERVQSTLASIEPFDVAHIDADLRTMADEMEMKLGKVLQPIRIAVSGKTVTPGMFETLALLGKEESRARIRVALDLLKEE